MSRVAVVAVFVMTFLLQPYRIPSASMEPTLQIGDFGLVNKQSTAPAGKWSWLMPYRKPALHDIVIFHEPVGEGTLLVKRVVAAPGDRLHLQDGTLYLNGVLQRDSFAQYLPSPRNHFRDDFPNLQNADPDADALWWIEIRHRMHYGELTVPADRFFVMGDNRNNSQDSRYWGFVPQENIVGEPLVIYFSVRQDTKGSFWQRLRHVARWRRILTVVR